MFKIEASAPASLMLLGEHAVLRNYPALVCAVESRIHLSLIPRTDEKIYIHSEIGELKTSLSSLEIDSRFKFITQAIIDFKTQLPSGFDLIIQSDFSHQTGLGSSAAVTSSCVTVLDRWINAAHPFDPHFIFLKARETVQKVQGLGSGADTAASVYGGIIFYRMNPLLLEKLSQNPPITAIYSGSKKPTVEVVKWLNEQEAQRPDQIKEILQKIELSCLQAKSAIEHENWLELGQILNQSHGYMQSLGLSNLLLDQLQHALCQQAEILGAKISGSGMGDCLIALGELTSLKFPQDAEQKDLGVQQFNLKIAEEGIRYAST